jgi:hypothetical protein
MLLLYRIEIHGIHFQDQNTEQWSNNNQTILIKNLKLMGNKVVEQNIEWIESEYGIYNECTIFNLYVNRPKKTLKGGIF